MDCTAKPRMIRWRSFSIPAIVVALLSSVAAGQQNDPNRPVGDIKFPPLIEAARRGDLAGVKARLAKGDAVDLRDQFQGTALEQAAWQGHLDIVKLLVERGADVNATGKAKSTGLMGAAVHDRTEIAQVLLKAGARVDPSDAQGKTALVLAAQSGSVKMIALLVKQGAKVDAQAADGTTPLVEAAACGMRESVQALLEAGANINLPDKNGQTPLIAAAGGRRAEVVAELLSRGADIRPTGPTGDTALELAKKRGDAEIVKLLAQAGTKKADRKDAVKSGKGKKRKSAAPDLVSSNVDGDDREIDPSLTELVLNFDRPMNTRRYHLATVNAKKHGVFPELVGDNPISFRDERTLVLRVKLQPNKKYGFGMNDDDRLEFRSAEGVPLEPIIFFFRTGGKPGEEVRTPPKNTPPEIKKPDAAGLFARLVEEPTKEKYLAARAFVIGHESYKPYSTDVFELGDTKTEAGSRQVLEAIQRCSPNLLFSPRAHLTAAVAAKTLGDEKRSQLEMEITRRLIRAILTTGEGTKNKPYLILRLTDQDDVLMHLRKKQERQSLVNDGGKFDVIRCTDGTDVWFDVSNIFGRR